MSCETAEAGFAVRGAERKWREHRQQCGMCAGAPARNRIHFLCPHGKELFQGQKDAAAELARQRELDKQPAPGQEAMF